MQGEDIHNALLAALEDRSLEQEAFLQRLRESLRFGRGFSRPSSTPNEIQDNSHIQPIQHTGQWRHSGSR